MPLNHAIPTPWDIPPKASPKKSTRLARLQALLDEWAAEIEIDPSQLTIADVPEAEED